MPAKSSFHSRHFFCATTALTAAGLWLSACAPPVENHAANNTASNAVGKGIPPVKNLAPAVKPKAKGTTFTLFVPNDQALLSLQTVRDTSTPSGATYEQKAKRVLELLWKKLEFLPPQTRLLEPPQKTESGVVRVNLSKEFLKLDSQNETPVALTLDAISKTLGALESKNGKPVLSAKVRFLVEGKTIRSMSEFALDEAWQASEKEDDETDAKPENKTPGDQNSNNATSNNATTNNATSEDKPGGGV